MTGKVLNRGPSSALVLILPIALIVVLVLKAWLYLILLFIVIALGNLWRTYRWKQQCEQVDPFFFALITEQQGYLTPIDLAVKANLSATTAENFLAKKAEEYGAQSKKINNKVAGYYFITTNALKSIFEESDPPPETDEIELSSEAEALTVASIPTVTSPDISTTESTPDSADTQEDNLSEVESIPDSPVNEADNLTESESTLDSPPDEEDNLSEVESTPDSPVNETDNLTESESTLETSDHQEKEAEGDDKLLPLTQTELAKRLNTNSNTIRKKRAASDFSNWTQSLDPQGIAWQYSPQDSSPKNILFEPLIDQTKSE